MILLILVAVLAALALFTQFETRRLEQRFPSVGQFFDVTGARLHVLDLGPRDAAGPPVVLVHGASSNFGSMRIPLGDMLAQRHRVILIDRPGHGWSTRSENLSPALQAKMIDDVLGQLQIERAIIVVHSLAGVLGLKMALDYPQRVAGLVSLAGVAYPWPGGVGTYNAVVTTPVVGPLLAYTITLPLGLLLAEPGTRSVFAPQAMPANYLAQSAIPLLLRPREFLANAWDLVTLKAAVTEQSPYYAELRMPVVAITGDADTTVSSEIHSRRLIETVPNGKLILLPGVGHMVQNAVPELVVGEIERIISESDTKPKAASR
ncbi:alpha/beta hydrolase [Tardiphaga alba]|uniref:Alpha/beta hydrolase n=1 Tax=Tardiphaga alba TaxID=340268 RepID=A0ABX8AE92_9BRAD|nr:alpha/beta hydrolase [Tardiphaga alba]QUS41616.1 alpha/beta hydrolase [Tardiphaga alba]